MKNTISFLIIVLLLSAFCVSCGSSKPKKTASKPTTKKKEKKKAPRVEIIQPVKPDKPALPPLPSDITTWKKKDFLRARAENHDRFDEACLLLGAPFEGKNTASFAVDVLKSVLSPLPIPEAEFIPKPVFNEDTEPADRRRLESEYNKKVKEQEDRIKNVPQLSSRSIAAIIEILGQNGDDTAWKLLLDMLQRRFAVDDDSDIDEYIIKTFLKYPRSNNLDTIFTMITQPDDLLQSAVPITNSPNKKIIKRLSANDVRSLAVDWLKKYSDPQFREKVTDYIIAHPENKALIEAAVPFLTTKNVGNIRCMHKLFMAPNILSEAEYKDMNSFLLNCSAGAFAAISNQSVLPGDLFANDLTASLRRGIENKVQAVPDTPAEADPNQPKPDSPDSAPNAAASSQSVASTTQAQAPATSQAQATPAETGEKPTSVAIPPYENINFSFLEAPKLMALQPEYALLILDSIWNDSFIAPQVAVWESKLEFRDKERDANTRFLLGLPLEGRRKYWRNYFASTYADGPNNLAKSPFLGYAPLDPGLIIELKRLKRATLPPTPQKKSSGKSAKNNPAKEKMIRFNASWMDFVRLAVKFQMERCFSGCGVQRVLKNDISKFKARTPFKIPAEAKILCEYHMILPNHLTKQLPNVHIDPVEIHYMQIKWETSLANIPREIKYNENGAPKLRYRGPGGSDSNNVWFEYNSPDFSESLDIRVAAKEESPRAQADGPIQIMSIRVRAEEEE